MAPGTVISCRAAVAWSVNDPVRMETIQVAAPKRGEVRIRIHSSGVCHSDLYFLRGGAGSGNFPLILGHEGAGIVESVGDDVTSVAAGDHVIPLWCPQCGQCDSCKSPDTNICSANSDFMWAGLMGDGTSRFSCNGKTILHFMGVSTFSEYTVVHEINVSKIDPKAPLEKVCLIGCGVSTGYGAVRNTAKVKSSSTVAIWGLGGIGLSVAIAAKQAGAKRIFGIDINPEKAEIGKRFGVSHFINPGDCDQPVEDVLCQMTNGGVDYAFECCGIPKCMDTALRACHSGWGVCTLVGLADMTAEATYNPFLIITGRTLKGTYFGGWKSRDAVPKLVEEYLSDELMVDELITHNLPIESINEAISLMKNGKCIRAVVSF